MLSSSAGDPGPGRGDTARAGTPRSSNKDAPCSTTRQHSAPPARTRCRPRSPPYTPNPEIDWPAAAARYHRLYELTGSPIVELNHAVAVAHTHGRDAALAIVDALKLDHYRYHHSTRAELLRRLGNLTTAQAAYHTALDPATTDPERRFLQRRLTQL